MVSERVRDYAHHFGLAQDYLSIDPLSLEHEASRLDGDSSQNDGDIGLAIGNAGLIAAERLTVDNATLSYLASCVKLPECQKADSYHIDVLRRFHDYTLELPLLASDPEVDLRSFRRRIAPDFENEHLPLENIDEGAEDSSVFPATCHQDLKQIWEQIRTEKPTMTPKAFQLLRECIPANDESVLRFLDADLEEYMHNKKRSVVSMSPPLLPLSPLTSPCLPALDMDQCTIPSDNTSLLEDDIATTEKAIFARDSVQFEVSDAPDVSRSVDESESCRRICDIASEEGLEITLSDRLPIHELKVEVPVSPSFHRAPPWSKQNASFSQDLDELLEAIPEPTTSSQTDADEDFDSLFDELIGPQASRARRSIEQEQLQETDHGLRLKVPIMDFSQPSAPWLSTPSGTSTTADCMTELRSVETRKCLWPLSAKAQRSLTWVPFPASLAKIETLDIITVPDCFEDMLARPDCIDSETLLWKPEGLRVFDETTEMSEDEIEEGSFPDQNDLLSLIRKRKSEMGEHDDNDSFRKWPSMDVLDCNETDVSKIVSKDHSDPVDADIFSAVGSLDLLISHKRGETRQRKARKSDHSQAQHAVVESHLDNPIASINDKVNQAFASPPSPNISMPTERRQYVISTVMLSQRSLMRCLCSLYTEADFIERADDSALDGSEYTSYAADVTISASTGLICTSLQKIKQRALPGQEKESAQRKLLDRVLHASQSHEQIYVLVSQSCPEGNVWPDLNANDCAALTEFTSFCAGLDRGISAIFVPGGEAQLAKWVCALMVQHGVSIDGFRMNEDISAQEILLVKAGLNPFAAQLLLWELGQRNICLGDFASVPTPERHVIFGRLLSSPKDLSRLGEGFESRWQGL